MADTREGSKGKESSGFAEALEIAGRFPTVCLSYEQARRDGELATRKLYDDAYREYARTANEAQVDAQKRYEEAAQIYRSAVQDAGSEQDAQERGAEAYRNYQEAVREADETAGKRIEDANRTYTSKVHDAHMSGQKLSQDAYRSYLRSVKELWSRMDVDALADAYALTSVNQQ